MTLCDTGPLVALINSGDVNHQRCSLALATLSSPLITTWPCFAESMYLLGRLGGYTVQEKLWVYVTREALQLHANTAEEIHRMPQLMQQYRDAPMDLADASLVATAETKGLRRIFTLDRHFYAYRVNGRDAFDVVP